MDRARKRLRPTNEKSVEKGRWLVWKR